MSYIVDLKNYRTGYFGYLSPEVRYTLGHMQDTASSGGVPGIVSTATKEMMSIDDNVVACSALGCIALQATTFDTESITAGGPVTMTGLVSFETNADAVAANAPVGTVYRTAAGELRVVV